MDVVTLGAALSIMKKMPDTAASSAAAAEDAADRAEEAARTLTVDDTLTKPGQPADSKAVGDALANKVDKVTGKGLSTEDYTTAEKTKLAELTQIEVDDTLTQTGQAADAKVTGDKIIEVKTNINFVADEYFQIEEKTAYQEVEGWRLIKSTGLCVADNSYKLIKFTVSPGQLIKVISDDLFQFQNSSSVPASGEAKRIGITYDAYNGFLEVPQTGTYLIMSSPINESTCKCYSTTKPAASDILKFKNAIKEAPSEISQNYALTEEGLSIANSSCDIYKYRLGEADKIKLLSPQIYQFQKRATNVPSSGTNQFLVGTPVSTPTYGTIDIPAEAEFLMLNVPHDDSFGGIYGFITSLHNETQSVNPILKTEKYIGHRGGGKTAPENTIPSMKQAYDNGIKIYELDLRFTSDNVPVMLHDSTINRTARNSDGSTISTTVSIGNITLAEALTYDFGIYKGEEYAGTKIPTLDDALLFAKKTGCCIELDLTTLSAMNGNIWKIIKDTIIRRGMMNSVFFTASSAVLDIIDNKHDICACVSNVGTAEADIIAASAQIDKSIYTMCSVQYPYATESQIALINQYGMVAKGFTVTSSAIANNLFNIGVDKMILDGLYPTDIELG